MEPHFIILIPCSGGSIYKWQVCAFYSQLSLIYLSKRVHLQSALSVGYRQADINEAFRFIRLAAWQATRGSIDFLVLWFIFFSFFLDHNEKHAWRISLVCRPYLSAPSLVLPPTIWHTLSPSFRSLSLAPSLFLSPSFSPFALFPSSQGKSSYLNWPQEPVLSDFNAPYSVDSISITLVTKD